MEMLFVALSAIGIVVGLYMNVYDYNNHGVLNKATIEDVKQLQDTDKQHYDPVIAVTTSTSHDSNDASDTVEHNREPCLDIEMISHSMKTLDSFYNQHHDTIAI